MVDEILLSECLHAGLLMPPFVLQRTQEASFCKILRLSGGRSMMYYWHSQILDWKCEGVEV